MTTQLGDLVIQDHEHDQWLASLDDTQWRVYHGRMLREVLAQVRSTNGRVSSLERFRYTAAGGLGVVTAVVVPLFVRMVAR